jgi:hypothetical protein
MRNSRWWGTSIPRTAGKQSNQTPVIYSSYDQSVSEIILEINTLFIAEIHCQARSLSNRWHAIGLKQIIRHCQRLRVNSSPMTNSLAAVIPAAEMAGLRAAGADNQPAYISWD